MEDKDKRCGRGIVILAGGESQRFQSYSYDKCLSTLNDLPLLQHTIDRVAEVAADEVIVAARDRKQGEEIRNRTTGDFSIVFDYINDFGPLSGFLAALEHTSCYWCLIIGCDMPFINPEVVEFLFDIIAASRSRYDAVVPCWENGMLEPLHAVYRRESTLSAIKNAVVEGDRRLSNLLAQLDVYLLPVEKIREIDPDLETFTNINTPAELELHHDPASKQTSEERLN
ncbi:MAG: molybdenum cofactor guanylyltransferase [Candidatus Methanophagaceae archaeon]|nr:MAG: molybdenum cofactor guanylyltransferase [Methanophagales archaeon]